MGFIDVSAGAAQGAALGSAGGIPGMIAGGVLGGLGGLFGGRKKKKAKRAARALYFLEQNLAARQMLREAQRARAISLVSGEAAGVGQERTSGIQGVLGSIQSQAVGNIERQIQSGTLQLKASKYAAQAQNFFNLGSSLASLAGTGLAIAQRPSPNLEQISLAPYTPPSNYPTTGFIKK